MARSNGKSLETWIWDAACSIRGAKEAAKFKDFILPLIFTTCLCEVFDDGLNRIVDTYRPIAEIVEEIETEARAADKELKKILRQRGITA